MVVMGMVIQPEAYALQTMIRSGLHRLREDLMAIIHAWQKHELNFHCMTLENADSQVATLTW